ncbi:MAG: AMP-binding protein [Proteobacteria bacterium]|nr:AMP-binding protein [Pseudomonadota bacterium]
MTKIITGDHEQGHMEALERSMKAAAGFIELGIDQNGGVAVMLHNDLSFFEACRGATHAGASGVPINWHFKGDEVGYILRDSNTKALVIHAHLLPQVEGVVPDDCAVLVVETPREIARAFGISEERCQVPAGMTGWSQWVDSHAPIAAPQTASHGMMFYTSGTTGRPKGVRREPVDPAKVIMRMKRVLAEAWGFTRTDIIAMMTGPLYHSAPYAYANVVTQLGSTLVMQPRFDAEDFLRLVEKHRISHAHMVPTMFVRLLALPDEVKTKYDLSSLEFITHGAAPCAPEVKRQMIDWMGPVINEYFGGTEIGIVTYATSQDSVEKPGTVGKAVTGARIEIFDEDGAPLAAGEIGEVYVVVDGMPDFTYQGLDERRAEIGRDGLVCIGDIGYLDDDGFLFLCDRKIEMVISGGVNIYPVEIEASLITMPGVKDCAVFGIPDQEFGEALAAYVEPETGSEIAADDVKAFLRGQLAGYKVPKLIEFADSLPRDDSGKIFKRKLREPYWEGMDRRI